VDDSVVDLGRQALLTVLLLISPVLLVALAVGVIVGAFQTMTQVHDASLAHVPRIVAILATVAIALPWLIGKMVAYSETLFSHVPVLLGG
jgi:flagellar biosynthetic protein FliQ